MRPKPRTDIARPPTLWEPTTLRHSRSGLGPEPLRSQESDVATPSGVGGRVRFSSALSLFPSRRSRESPLFPRVLEVAAGDRTERRVHLHGHVDVVACPMNGLSG